MQAFFHRITLSITTLLLFGLCLPSARAQQTMADADWFKRELGVGVTWRYYQFTGLYGRPQAISYIEADLSNPAVSVQLPYLTSARQRISQMVPAQSSPSKAAINGSYFATTGSGGHVTYLRIGNAVIPPGGDLFSPFGYEGAVAKSSLGITTIRKIPTGGWQNAPEPDILACGPVVLYDNVVPSSALTAIGSHCTDRHPRSAVGITQDNRFILFVVDGRSEFSAGMTCEEVGLAMKELGCDDALNLDGGGSSTLWGAGEPYSGVLNFPSDNGAFDHLGERACSNAIAIASAPAAPAQWDARLTQKTFNSSMGIGTSQTVSLQYTNIGTGTWTAADTRLVLARPTSRTSVFQNAAWTSANQPAIMTPATVAPGQTATFTFILQAPVLPQNALFDENFVLTKTSVGRIGPADSDAWMRISVQRPVEPETDFLVESRAGGNNWAWYSDSGMADVSSHSNASGITPGLGSRYGSTYRSVAGAKIATAAPDFPQDDFYRISATWPAGGSRKNPITYKVNTPSGSTKFLIDQENGLTNDWQPLGASPFFFEKGFSGSVAMSNEDIDVSGNMFFSGVKFEYVPTPASDKSYEVRYLAASAVKPVIDGTASSGEWNAAAPAGNGFVDHQQPVTPAVEDGNFRMLFDDTYLYILFTMQNAHLPSYPLPPSPYGYSNLPGDRIGFFLTPGGVKRQKFYRLLLSPNPTNGQCYVWSQASLFKTTDSNVGTTWSQRGGAAYTYNASQLVIEYKIPWANFNFPGMQYASCPTAGDIWGLQASITNNTQGTTWESVNWEPDPTGSFVMGEPYGKLQFTIPQTSVDDWPLY